MKKRLVLFDFDGTITTKDTFLEFIKYYHGVFRFLWGFVLLSPWIVLFRFGLIPNWKAKQYTLRWFFKGESIADFNKKSEAFCRTIVPGLIRPKAREEITRHLTEGADVVIISASAENWVRPWCTANNLNCLATQLEVKDDRITGNISGFNCYGTEKQKRIQACYTLSDYDEVIAYGDSRGDLEMLSLAQQQYYKPFRT